jgi:NAD(P)-dependent dehydrogenase (short-subunit alcohol dehydrogenase family)
VAEGCVALGARVHECSPAQDPTTPGAEAALDASVAAAVRETGVLDLLVVDGAGLFAAGLAPGGSGHAALRACLDGAWDATRAAANHAFIPAAEHREAVEHSETAGGSEAARRGGPSDSTRAGGRIVLLAPTPDAGEHADAACAGLENLARTLSTEWARYGITTVAIAPGVQAAAEEVAALVAYLAAPAGAYFSGCLLDLRGVVRV